MVAFRRPILIQAILLFAFVGASQVGASVPDASGIEALIEGNRLPIRDGDLRVFYQQRSFAPAWTDADARLARAMLAHADQDGLDPGDYAAQSGSSAAEDDILLTEAVLS